VEVVEVEEAVEAEVEVSITTPTTHGLLLRSLEIGITLDIVITS